MIPGTDLLSEARIGRTNLPSLWVTNSSVTLSSSATFARSLFILDLSLEEVSAIFFLMSESSLLAVSLIDPVSSIASVICFSKNLFSYKPLPNSARAGDNSDFEAKY